MSKYSSEFKLEVVKYYEKNHIGCELLARHFNVPNESIVRRWIKRYEEKSANFLYLIVKDHVFIDGNKRVAATLFIYFLNFYNILYKNDKQVIDNNTLTALTLLVAESNPKEKDIIIELIMNFLYNNY